MYNKKALSDAISKLNAAKAPKQEPDILYSPEGQWKHPGQTTRVPGEDITMANVPYPVMAYPNIGQPQMMQPEENYSFPGADYVDEVPMARRGGTKRLPRGKTKSLSGVNKLLQKNPLLRTYKHKLFDPTHPTFQTGGENNFVEADLTEEEIEQYKKGGFIIEELPQAQSGKNVRYTDNPNDPGIQAYADSLSLLNAPFESFKISQKADALLEQQKYEEARKVLNFDRYNIPSYKAYNRLTQLNRETPTPIKGSEYGWGLNPSDPQSVRFKKPVQPVKYRDPKVTAKQQQLVDAGYDIGEIDGIWGPKSQAAWDEYQSKQDVPQEDNTTESVQGSVPQQEQKDNDALPDLGVKSVPEQNTNQNEGVKRYAYKNQTVLDPATGKRVIKQVPYSEYIPGKGWVSLNTPGVVKETPSLSRGGNFSSQELPKAQSGSMVQNLLQRAKEQMSQHKVITDGTSRFVQNNPLPTQKVPANRQEAEEMIRKGEIKLETPEEITQRRLKSKDTWLENVIELLDPTGISSHDDAERAYYQWKDSKSSYPDFGQVMDMFGAVPLLGKFGKLKYLKEGPKIAYGLIPWQKILNATDGAQDITKDNLLQQQGGSIELELTPEEIKKYQEAGYVVEELPKAQSGENLQPTDEDKDFFTKMINSPLFVERYARMIGKPAEDVKEEAENYRQQMLNNLNTVRINSPGVNLLPDGFKNADGYYFPGPSSEDSKTFNKKRLQPLFDNQHSVFLKEDEPSVRTHEISHATVKGNVPSFAKPFSFRDLSVPRETFGLINQLKEQKLSSERNQYISEQPYYQDDNEIKARVDVARKELMQRGLYDPSTENFTEEHYNALQNILNESIYSEPAENENRTVKPENFNDIPANLQQVNDLMYPFDKESVIRMFNDIVYSDKSESLNIAKRGGSKRLLKAQEGLTQTTPTSLSFQRQAAELQKLREFEKEKEKVKKEGVDKIPDVLTPEQKKKLQAQINQEKESLRLVPKKVIPSETTNVQGRDLSLEAKNRQQQHQQDLAMRQLMVDAGGNPEKARALMVQRAINTDERKQEQAEKAYEQSILDRITSPSGGLETGRAEATDEFWQAFIGAGLLNRGLKTAGSKAMRLMGKDVLLPGANLGNLAAAYGAVYSPYNIYEGAKDISQGNYVDGSLQLAEGVLDAYIPGSRKLMIDGAQQAGKYLTQGPLKNAYKINPNALKDKDVEILQRWQFDNQYNSSLPGGILDDKYTGRFYGSNWNNHLNGYSVENTTVPSYMVIRPGSGEIRTAIVPKGSADLPEELLTGYGSSNIMDPNVERILPENIPYMSKKIKKNPFDNTPIMINGDINPDYINAYKEMLKIAKAEQPKPHWWKGYELANTPKQLPGSSVASSVDDVGRGLTQIPQTPKPAWQLQELPGLHLKSTMEGESISKIVEPKTGLVNVEQALAIIGKESNGADKVALIKQGLGDNIPKKMDFNEFRKITQDQLIPLERQFSTARSDYGFERIGYVDRKVVNGVTVDTSSPNLLENQTLILGNKNKFGKGSSAHGNPDETLGHIHFLRDAETPDVLTVTQIQSDAFQSSNHYLNKPKAKLEYHKKSLDESLKDIESIKDFGAEDYEKMIINPRKQWIKESEKEVAEVLGSNPSQKQLLDKNHQERYLQELVDYAGKRGDVNKVRVPTSETANSVQGYSWDKLSGNVLKDKKDLVVKLKLENADPNIIKKIEDEITILKKYSEQPKTIKKLFGEEPKIVTDSKGNTWYEFDIPKKFKEGKGEIKAFNWAIPATIATGAAASSNEYQKGGFIEAELTQEEIDNLRKQGYTIEEL